MTWKRHVLIIFVICLCSGSIAIGQEQPFTIEPERMEDQEGVYIDKALWVHKTQSHQEQEHVPQYLNSAGFIQYSTPLTEGKYWLKLVFQIAEYDSNLYLRLNSAIRKITFYQILSNDTIIQHAGASILPLKKSYSLFRDNIFHIIVTPGQPITAYLKLEAEPGEELALKARVHRISAYAKYIGLRKNIALIFTSIFITLSLYNFFIYWILREKVYFYYSFMVLGFALHAGMPLLYTAYTTAFIDSLSIAIASSIIFSGAMFSIHFLGLKKLLVWYRLMILLAYVNGTIVCLIVGELMLLGGRTPFDYISSLVAAFSALWLFLLWIITSIKIWNTKDKRGKYFLLTNIPALIGAFIFTIMWLGETFNFTAIEVNNSLTVNIIFYAGMTLQLLLFSAIFGYYIRKLEREKLEIQANINVQLEEKVNERTATLQAANLKISGQKDELKTLNAIKDKLLSIISHDLRSPLNSLQGMLTLFRSDTVTPEEMKDYSFKINDALSNTSTVLNNMLNWAKSQMSGIEVRPAYFDIKKLISENISLVQPLLDKKKITLKNTTGSLQALVWADRNMIDLVIRNLLSNAIKFTNPEGNIVIEGKENNNTLVLKISDDGVGMSEEKQKTLFDISQLEPSTGTSSEKGTGLGLILSKDFIEMNNGSLEVFSKEEEGSTFSLNLPLKP